MSELASVRSSKMGARLFTAGLLSVVIMAPALGAPPPTKPAISEEASAALSQMSQPC